MKLHVTMGFSSNLCYIDRTIILYDFKTMSNEFHILKFGPFRSHFECVKRLMH